MARPRLILITGPGGTGKSTLARAVGDSIGAPVVSRDAIKEGQALTGLPAGLDEHRRNLAANAAFFAVLESLLRSKASLVAEAAFQHRLWLDGLQPLLDLAEPRVIRCQVPYAVARQRAEARAATQPNRAAHADVAYFAAERPFEALSLDAPHLVVDTGDGWRPGIEDIIRFCRHQPGGAN